LTTAVTTNKGKVLKLVTLNDLEKLPTLVEDRLVQSSGAGDETVPSEAANFIEAQNLISQFRVYSGPNVHSEEGADPYAWVICGSRTETYGEALCDNVGGAQGGPEYAIAFNSNFQNQLGDSVLARFGNDLNPNLPDSSQQAGIYIACVAGGVNCLSNPGTDGMYGTADDGTIYYREAQENGLRGWIRETNGHTFSFLGADNDGTHNGSSPANFGLTQLVTQETEGFLMSCLGCNPHSLPAVVETITYQLDWPAVPTAIYVPHPPDSPTSTFSIVP
jgi:hypothetical protein